MKLRFRGGRLQKQILCQKLLFQELWLSTEGEKFNGRWAGLKPTRPALR